MAEAETTTVKSVGPCDVDAPFQILSLDGGGQKGLFSAAVLAEFERDLDTRVVDHFDLITGTSTGGLIALGLGAGMRPQEIVDFYTTHGSEIFGRGRGIAGRMFKSKHNPKSLRAALETVFQDQTLGASAKRLVIPSFSLDGNDVYVFKTSHHPRLTRDHAERVVDVALATSAAPTFFPPAELRHNRLIDGGVWANSPALVGVTEAVSMLDVSLSRIRVLSMGTTGEVRSAPEAAIRRAGLLSWARPIVPLLLEAQACGSLHAAEHLVGPDNFVRVNSSVPEGLFELDNIDERAVRGLAETIARAAAPKFTPFRTHLAPTFTPFHSKEALRA